MGESTRQWDRLVLFPDDNAVVEFHGEEIDEDRRMIAEVTLTTLERVYGRSVESSVTDQTLPRRRVSDE